MFFPFQLALPKTSVLLLCQTQQRFSFLIAYCSLHRFALCLFPFAFGTFRPLPFEILPVVFLFSVVSFAVFWGQYSLFFNVCLFQQSFPYLFVYCFLPFAPFLCFWDISPFALWKFTHFFILCCFIRCLFGAVFALFQCLCVSTAVFLPFLYCFLPLCPFPFAFGTFRPLPFGSLLVFLFYVVSFAVFLGQYSLFFNVCLFQQRFSYLFYIVFCPFAPFLCF